MSGMERRIRGLLRFSRIDFQEFAENQVSTTEESQKLENGFNDFFCSGGSLDPPNERRG
jgi:hypothetical protein